MWHLPLHYTYRVGKLCSFSYPCRPDICQQGNFRICQQLLSEIDQQDNFRIVYFLLLQIRPCQLLQMFGCEFNNLTICTHLPDPLGTPGPLQRKAREELVHRSSKAKQDFVHRNSKARQYIAQGSHGTPGPGPAPKPVRRGPSWDPTLSPAPKSGRQSPIFGLTLFSLI